MAKERIVIADDDDFMREGLLETLAKPEFKVEGYPTAEAALEALAEAPASLLLTDLRMPGMDGLELLERVRRLDPDLPVVVMTAYATVETAVRAMKTGAFDYILKPFKAEELEVVVDKALRHRRLVAENTYLKDELAQRYPLADFVGDCPAMRVVFDRIRQVAPSPATVFIRGESGTGKELVARALHAQSPRRERPLVRVNCAALGAGVLESELFGHEKGAFTGADRRRIGRFELADGGTLFLDEVSEMDLHLQGKLLRVLQEKEFERVGSSETISVDVRILASSNRDMEKAIADGKFRHDLYFRLNVVTVDLPPLRERLADVRPLAEFFVRKFHREDGTPLRRITDEAYRLLETYDWPGNVRELQNIMERALVLGTGDAIDAPLIENCLMGAPGRRLGAVPAAPQGPDAAAVTGGPVGAWSGLPSTGTGLFLPGNLGTGPGGAATPGAPAAASTAGGGLGDAGRGTAIMPLTGGLPGATAAAARGEGLFAPRPLDDVEREHILKMLQFFNGARAKTADALGISERSLRDRLKRWRGDAEDA